MDQSQPKPERQYADGVPLLMDLSKSKFCTLYNAIDHVFSFASDEILNLDVHRMAMKYQNEKKRQ